LKKSLNSVFGPLALVIILAVAGCGGGNNDNKTASTSTTPTTTSTPTTSGGAGATTKLTLAADPGGQLKFDKTKLTAKAGKVTITMDNPSVVPHSVAIEGSGVDKDGTGGTSGVGKGEKSTVTADLKPGTYEFYCPVDGHKAAGMKGTLTVK
jgi:plastocyanin